MRRPALALLAALVIGSASRAQYQIPQPTDDLVTDLAGILSPEQEEAIRAVTAPLREAGTPIVVLTLVRTGDFGFRPDQIRQLANAVYDAWGIGQPGDDRGALLVVAREDRKLWIAPGRGYSSADAELQRIIDGVILSRFREDDYPGGILEGVKAIRDRVVRPGGAAAGAPRSELPTVPLPERGSPPSRAPGGPSPGPPPDGGGIGFGGGSWICLGLGLLLVIVVVVSLIRRAGSAVKGMTGLGRSTGLGGFRRSRPGWGGVLGGLGTGFLLGQVLGGRRRGSIFGGGSSGPSIFGGGGGGLGGGGSGGGFGSSFGGGRSSGGGAGGSW